MNPLPPKILVWYDKGIRLWTAVYQDEYGNQQYCAGYGMSKKEAIEDVQYQKRIQETKSASSRPLVGEVSPTQGTNSSARNEN